MFRDREHRPGVFKGIGEQTPMHFEHRELTKADRPVSVRLSSQGSLVEDQICFRETVRELGDYLSGLSEAEVVALQAQVVLPQLPKAEEMLLRTIDRLGVTQDRLTQIREEMKSIVSR